ncbi:MAG: hypothetical protein OIF56_03545 [Cohaesibacter sp.]|nr:hypothetical protein [Cohaesibacter sp.]
MTPDDWVILGTGFALLLLGLLLALMMGGAGYVAYRLLCCFSGG